MSKKVVHIVLNYFTNDSRIMRECDALANKDYQVTVIALWNNDLKLEELYSKYKIIRIPISTKFLGKNPLIQIIKYIEFLFKTILLIKRIKPSICHGHDPSGLFIACISKYIYKTKVIYDSHELWSESINMRGNKRVLFILVRKIEKYFIKYAEEVITVNQSIADIIKIENKIEHINVIRNISDKSTRKIIGNYKINLPDSCFNIIYVGNIEKGRGINILIQSMLQVDKDIGLVLLGRNSIFKSKMKELSRFLKLEKRIHFLDEVNPENVVSVCKKADLGISPIENICKSYYLSLPNKIFEYIQAGIPIVASNFPEMKKIINQFDIGLTFNIESKQSIADSINEIYKNKQIYERYCNNVKLASLSLNWDSEQSVLHSIYKKLS